MCWNLDGPPFTEFKWIQASHGKLPPYAIFGGYDSMNKTNLYIARAEHKGCLIPGKYVPMEGCVYISWGDEEIRKEIYEVNFFLIFKILFVGWFIILI